MSFDPDSPVVTFKVLKSFKFYKNRSVLTYRLSNDVKMPIEILKSGRNFLFLKLLNSRMDPFL